MAVGQALNDRDILETQIYKIDHCLLETLLIDRSRGGRLIRWATDSYVSRGAGYGEWDEITVASIINKNGQVVQPRVDKSKDEQRRRSVDKAEVFTPSWICNQQNNLVDAAWFGNKFAPFNEELPEPDDLFLRRWKRKNARIRFSKKKKTTWEGYVKANRLEISCGEAPYLVSRYDTVTGRFIEDPMDRIGVLDRKLRVVSENVDNAADWRTWTLNALKATYGFEYQGDSLLIARENVLWSVRDWYQSRHFDETLAKDYLRECAEVISWNLWQMDGIKYVAPNTCHPTDPELDMYGQVVKPSARCPGCSKKDVAKHNGVRCRIMDWESGKTVYFMPPFTFQPIEEVANG